MSFLEYLIYVPLTLILLNLLVVVHEFGHFITARKAGVRTPEFSLGFGPLLAKTLHNGVQYSLRAIPLGGFVKIAGMDMALEGDSAKEEPEAEEIPYKERFDSLKLWKKIGIIIAGPMNNLILAFLGFILMAIVIGVPVNVETARTVIGTVELKSPAIEAGLQPGDQVLSINDKAVNKWEDLYKIINKSPGKSLKFVILRENKQYVRTIKPFLDPHYKVGRIGIGPPIIIKRVSLGKSITYGFKQGIYAFTAVIDALGRMIVGKERLNGLGPVGMVSAVQQATKSGSGGYFLFYLFTMFNLFLGFFNLLPIPLPLLDGGWVTILIIEKLRGKSFTGEQKAVAQMIGMGLMLVLFVLITYSDIASQVKQQLGRF